MKFDRILAEILNFINSLLWHREAPDKKAKPYERLRTWRLEGRGILHQVSRPPDLCPRAVATFIYEPLRLHGSPQDLHLYADHLEGLMHPIRPGTQLSRCRPTHRITILKASHWIGPDGRYRADELFSINDDLQGQSSRRDGHVVCILYQMAVATSGQSPIQVNWKLELNVAKKVCMGSQFTNSLDVVDSRKKEVIAYDLEGKPAARIRLLALICPILVAWMEGLNRQG